MKKNNILLIVILLICISLIASSFAFFGGFVSEVSNTDVSVKSDTLKKLIFTEGEDLNLVVNEDKFTSEDGSISGNVTSSATLFASESSGSVTDSYNVYYLINNNEFAYTLNDTTPELILTVTDPNGNIVTVNDKLNFVEVTDYHTGNLIKGFDVTTFEGLITIAQDYSIQSSDSVNGIKQEWDIKLTFINHNHLQNANNGKILEGNFILSDEYHSFYFYDYLKYNLNQSDGFYYHDDNLLNSANDNNYRFSGSNDIVKNYIYFNNETWRIVGVFDNNVKLVLNNKLGERAFGSNYYWTSSSLNEYLNTTYYNSLGDFNKLIAPKKYTSAIIPYSELGTYNAQEMYSAEMISLFNDFYNVGLLNPSDFMFSSSVDYWDLENFTYTNNSSVLSNNWLYNSANLIYERTISAASYDTRTVLGIYNTGRVDRSWSYDSYSFRPVIYLSENIYYDSGEGTESDPFVVTLNNGS